MRLDLELRDNILIVNGEELDLNRLYESGVEYEPILQQDLEDRLILFCAEAGSQLSSNYNMIKEDLRTIMALEEDTIIFSSTDTNVYITLEYENEVKDVLIDYFNVLGYTTEQINEILEIEEEENEF